MVGSRGDPALSIPCGRGGSEPGGEGLITADEAGVGVLTPTERLLWGGMAPREVERGPCEDRSSRGRDEGG